jgi:hypothetical protein
VPTFEAAFPQPDQSLLHARELLKRPLPSPETTLADLGNATGESRCDTVD